jgi:C1A family cysteine protease
MPMQARQHLIKRVKDQGERPTCVAFAVSALHEYWIDICCASKAGIEVDLSEEFLFYGCKMRDGLKGTRSGTTLVAASASLVSDGQCLEQLHPYQQKSSLVSVPTRSAFADGKSRILKTLVRQKLELALVRESLAKNIPVVAAIELFKSAYRPGPTGLLRLPSAGEKRVGRHAVLIVDVETSGLEEQMVFLNSWGAKWGDAGLGRFTFQYFSSHCKQLWNIEG